MEESGKVSDELIEDIDVLECLDEIGALYIRKLIMLLKQEYNYSLESKDSVM